MSYLQRALTDERGQVLPWVAFLLVSLLGAAGLTVDAGRAYVLHSQLQNSSNAAALAAAGNVYNSGSTNNATTVATQYSSGAKADENYNATMGTVKTTVTTVCLNVLMNGATCGSGSQANAVKVKQVAAMPTMFMRLFGINTLNIAASATASMEGMAQPWSVAVIVDSTGSMNTADSNCGGVTEFQCALSGVQAMLKGTNPTCVTGSVNCPGGYDFRVALFTFPNVLTSVNGALPTVKYGSSSYTYSKSSQDLDISCGGSPGSYTSWKTQPLAAPYTLPKPGATLPTDSAGRVYMTYTQTVSPKATWTASYQITPFLSDYYDPSNTSAGGLNPNSQLVQTVGYGSTLGCLTYTFGVDGASGTGSNFGNTYFASSIYEAQAALAIEKAANPNSQTAIIFLSDGQANASYFSKNSSAYGGSSPYYNSTNQFNEATEFPEALAGSEVGPTSTSYPVPAYYTPATAVSTLGYSTLGVNGTGIYPDWNDQCQQAIAAGQYALSATGNFKVDRVYAVAYGSESSGCSNGWSVGATDTKDVTTGTLNQSFSGSSILPCTTMEDIASSWDYFYSDNQQSGNVNLGCTDNNHSVVSLQQIFSAIAATFTSPRLISNSAT
ncbi:MAG TPA: Tad domain-containing protein [Terracidiphilus sp.]|jgi:hypothetical protein